MNHWMRVTKKDPCPICGKDSWCLIGQTSALCMRVQSAKPKTFTSGETGWIHPLDAIPAIYHPPPETKRMTVDCNRLMNNWRDITTDQMWSNLAKDLGLPEWTLNISLGAVYALEHRAWAFPMWNGFGHMIGIRLRADDGRKWTVKDTHSGIFVPMANPKPTCMICEGPTDTAAALALGYYAVGRPSCCGGAMHIKHLFQRTGVKRAVIMTDNDGPGLNGARGLSDVLMVPCVIICLPAKDVRDYVNNGGTRPMIDCLIHAAVWHHYHQ